MKDAASQIPEDAQQFRIRGGRKPIVVYIHEDTGTIYFQNCHVPHKFLASATPSYSCSIDDTQAVHVYRGQRQPKESLTIISDEGKAVLVDQGANYKVLRDKMKQLVPVEKPGYSRENPMMGAIYFGGALIGLALGVACTPKQSTDMTLGIFVTVGTTLGLASGHVLIWIADRYLKINLVRPLGYGIFAMCNGVVSAALLGSLVNWNTFVQGAILLLCGSGMAGFTYGVYQQRRISARQNRDKTVDDYGQSLGE